MDYPKHYDKLMTRARGRELLGYVEVHHVIPKCIGGSNDSGNLVRLTAEEHYLAHQLLHKMHPGVSGLTFAMINMTGNPYGHRNNNKLYGWMRRKASAAMTLQMETLKNDPTYKANHRAAMEKLRSNPEYVSKMSVLISELHKGKVRSPQVRANIAAGGRNRKRRVFSAEARANMAVARRKTWDERKAAGTDKLIAQKTVATRKANGSYSFSQEWRDNISEGNKRRYARASLKDHS